MMKLTTIGYEGASLEDFVRTLAVAGVNLLLDVRAVAASRRKGFSKSPLSEAVAAAGIDYIHLKGLGDPKEGREAARAGNYNKFLRIFTDHMETEEARAALQAAVEYIRQSTVCLMCYERDPNECHRKLVADTLSDSIGLTIQHLGVKEGLAANGGKRGPRKSPNTREGVATRG